MNKCVLRALGFSAALLLLTACGGGGSSATSTVALTPPLIRLVNAGVDAPALTVAAIGSSSTSLIFSGLDFGSPTALQHQAADSYEIKFSAILPDNSTQTIADQTGIALTTDNETSVYLAGSIADGSTRELVVNRPLVDVPSDKTELQVVHAASRAPAVSVYVTGTGDALDNAKPIADLSFPSAGTPVNLASGSYRIRVTAQGDPNTVYFDTGQADAIALAGGASLQLSLIDNTGAGSAPVRVLLLDGRNTAQPFQLLSDPAAPVRLRVINASPDAGSIDLYASATGSGFSGSPQIAKLAYGSAQTLCSFAAGDDDFEATAAGAGAASPLPGLTLTNQTLTGGSIHALVALGRVGGQPAAALGLGSLDERPIFTEADLHFIHGAPALGAVNIYVTPAGSVSDAQIQAGGVTPTVLAFQPGQLGGDLRFMPGSYDIRVADATSNAIDVEQTGVNLGAGLRQTLTLLGADESGSGGPQQATLLVLATGECP
ncbi:MAG: DUF4397 domain-containing protein [Gammaproteobacteria bacterium]|nr:DUF4397 domain-containing protein [Gammaproteobacteria bacterium]